ncbi:hypothetical protein I3760_16G079600 [Carya illinoinensis]|nr:hypothetical protein I3760_16G079600 [Carya illinoinensis]
MELQHFKHNHPLFLNEEGESPFYRLCRERVSGPNYSCKECHRFVIHKSCFELPPELQHPLHPNHPLILISSKLIPNESVRECVSCKKYRPWGLTYNCSHCEFNLCINCDHCAKQGNGMFYFCAPCPFVKSFPFTCNACGKAGNSMFYFCNMCSFVAHLDCASLPLVVKVIQHEHPLDLTYSIPATQSTRKVCKLCVNRVNTNYAYYYCSSCDFAAHLHGSTSKENRDETFHFEDKEFSDPEAQHFSHEHDLELIDKHGIDKKCDGCVRSIFPPFYTFVQCGFFLHKSCVELPRKIPHSLHEHPLMLLPRSPYTNNLFLCYTCHCMCNGFIYHCDKCDFLLNVQCSLLSYMFKHDSHEHQLMLSKLPIHKKCSCCNSSQLEYKFCCADREFIVDFRCLTLPHSIRYREDEHPFTLCYAREDDSDEYYCDICEKKKNETQSIGFTVFEKACTFDIHQHPLILVRKTKHKPLGKKCSKACTDPLSYECVKCNFNFHTNCLRPSSTLKELELP